MTCYFIGGVVGSALASVIYAEHGWAGSSLLGAGFGACTVLLWAGQTLRRRRAAAAGSGGGAVPAQYETCIRPAA